MVHELFMRIAAIFHDKMSQNLSWLFFSIWFFILPLSHPGGAAFGFLNHSGEFPHLLIPLCQYYWLIGFALFLFCFVFLGWGGYLFRAILIFYYTLLLVWFFIPFHTHLNSPDVLAVGLMEGDNGKVGFTLLQTLSVFFQPDGILNILFLFPLLVSYLLLVTLIGLWVSLSSPFYCTYLPIYPSLRPRAREPSHVCCVAFSLFSSLPQIPAQWLRQRVQYRTRW